MKQNVYVIEKNFETSHQQRVVEEANELGIKLTALYKFIRENDVFKKLDDEEQGRLIHQARIMNSYFEVLEDRINNF